MKFLIVGAFFAPYSQVFFSIILLSFKCEDCFFKETMEVIVNAEAIPNLKVIHRKKVQNAFVFHKLMRNGALSC